MLPLQHQRAFNILIAALTVGPEWIQWNFPDHITCRPVDGRRFISLRLHLDTSRTFATWLPFVNRRRCCVVDCVPIFDPCINRGSVYVLDPRWEAFTTGERQERGQWPTWFGGHIAWDHMYEGMQERDPGRTDAVCYLWIANCSVTGQHVTPPDQRFIKVRHETLMSERTHKRLNVLLVVCCAPSARDKKPLSEISVLFIHSLRWRERKKKKKPFMCLFLRALSTWCAATTAPAYSLIFFLLFLLSDIPASPSAG